MTTSTQPATNPNNFDFNAFNAILSPNGRKIAAGLQIALAEGLIKDALYQMENYHNPLAEDLHGVYNELKTFRVTYKAAAKARADQRATIPAPAVDQRPIVETTEQVA